MTAKWIVFLVFSQVYLSVHGDRSFVINWLDFAIEIYNPRLMGMNATIGVHNNISVLSGYAILNDTLDDLKIRIAVDNSLPNGIRRPAFDYTLDICKSFKMSPKSNIATSFWHEMMSFGHFVKSCPIPARENYTLENYYIDPERFPPYTPELTFIAEVTVYFDGKLAALMNIVSEIESKKKVKLRS